MHMSSELLKNFLRSGRTVDGNIFVQPADGLGEQFKQSVDLLGNRIRGAYYFSDTGKRY
jgi:hypothetical protein